MKRKLVTRAPGHGGREVAREPRLAICLHYDGSGSDAGAEGWFQHPDAWNVGYQYLVLDDGTVVDFQLYGLRVYHAGKCRPSKAILEHSDGYRDANSALIGVAIAATAGELATWPQKLGVADICLEIFEKEGWGPEEGWRLTGHSDEAWKRRRKWDPIGHDKKRPVMHPQEMRELVAFTAKTRKVA